MKETVSQPRAAKADWTLEVTELCIYTNKNGRCYCLKWFSALKVWQLPNFCGGPCQTFVVAHAKLLFHKTRYPEWAKILAIAKLMWKIPNNFLLSPSEKMSNSCWWATTSSLKSNSSSKVFLGFSLLRLKQKSLKTLFLAIFSLFHIWPKKVLKFFFWLGRW